ncbi:hypothetical protein CEXT_553291, partial [Caerostris extrusa]
ARKLFSIGSSDEESILSEPSPVIPCTSIDEENSDVEELDENRWVILEVAKRLKSLKRVQSRRNFIVSAEVGQINGSILSHLHCQRQVVLRKVLLKQVILIKRQETERWTSSSSSSLPSSNQSCNERLGFCT